jgi:hypothetical protein
MIYQYMSLEEVLLKDLDCRIASGGAMMVHQAWLRLGLPTVPVSGL